MLQDDELQKLIQDAEKSVHESKEARDKVLKENMEMGGAVTEEPDFEEEDHSGEWEEWSKWSKTQETQSEDTKGDKIVKILTTISILALVVLALVLFSIYHIKFVKQQDNINKRPRLKMEKPETQIAPVKASPLPSGVETPSQPGTGGNTSVHNDVSSLPGLPSHISAGDKTKTDNRDAFQGGARKHG